MLVPGLVANACPLACRLLFGLQNGDPQNLTFYEFLWNMIKTYLVFVTLGSEKMKNVETKQQNRIEHACITQNASANLAAFLAPPCAKPDLAAYRLITKM